MVVWSSLLVSTLEHYQPHHDLLYISEENPEKIEIAGTRVVARLIDKRMWIHPIGGHQMKLHVLHVATYPICRYTSPDQFSMLPRALKHEYIILSIIEIAANYGNFYSLGNFNAISPGHGILQHVL